MDETLCDKVNPVIAWKRGENGVNRKLLIWIPFCSDKSSSSWRKKKGRKKRGMGDRGGKRREIKRQEERERASGGGGHAYLIP